MSQDTTVADLEIRIAYLEDQIDALNRPRSGAAQFTIATNSPRELHALANLVPATDRTDVTTRCQRRFGTATTLLNSGRCAEQRCSVSRLIRTYPDFPKPGILFYDVSSIIENVQGLRLVVESLTQLVEQKHQTCSRAIDSRGFLLAPPVALACDIGVVLVRKIREITRGYI